MTIGQAVERANVSEPADGSPYWADVAVRFANRMAWADFSRGDLANLRRMRPERPGPAVYWRLMGQEELAGQPSPGGQMGTDSSRHRVDDVDGPGRFGQPQRPRWLYTCGKGTFSG